MEKARVALPHGLQQLHILHGAVHHGAAVRRDDAVGEVEAALDGALQEGAARLTEEVCHIIGRDIDGTGVRGREADGDAVPQVQKRLRHVLAGVGDADLPILLRLLDERVVGLLQELFKIGQMFQISHIFCSLPHFLSVMVLKNGHSRKGGSLRPDVICIVRKNAGIVNCLTGSRVENRDVHQSRRDTFG